MGSSSIHKTISAMCESQSKTEWLEAYTHTVFTSSMCVCMCLYVDACVTVFVCVYVYLALTTSPQTLSVSSDIWPGDAQTLTPIHMQTQTDSPTLLQMPAHSDTHTLSVTR